MRDILYDDHKDFEDEEVLRAVIKRESTDEQKEAGEELTKELFVNKYETEKITIHRSGLHQMHNTEVQKKMEEVLF